MKRISIALMLALSLMGVGLSLPPQLWGIETAKADASNLARTALSYLQKSRAQAEPAFLSRAEKLLEKSLELDGSRNFEAFLGMASLSNARHQFTGSIEWAEQAIAVNPHNASPHGLLGDALFELGNYEEADAAYQKMIDIRPDLASYVRASYSYQFRGQTKAAIGALRLAIEAAGPKGSEAAWIRHQLGDVFFGAGQLRKAARQNRIGTRLAPGYIPPTVGLAEVDIARGRLSRAIATMERAVKELPSLEYLITLGDLYSATGRERKAHHQYELALEKIALYYSHGVRPDVDFVLFQAEHQANLDETLAAAREIYAERPTPAAADALAWTLHQLGRDQEAWPYVRRVVRSSVEDGAFSLHAATIASSLGRTELARAQLLNAEEMKLQLSPVQAVGLEALNKL